MKEVFDAIDKKLIPVPDEAGLIAAGLLAMIINEAGLTLEEGVSSKEEINIAIKLCMNYRLGPFEWGVLIG